MTSTDLLRHSEQTALIWSIAEILRGDYKQSEYGRVVLPFVVLRRLDCLLEPNKEAVLKAAAATLALAGDAIRAPVSQSDTDNPSQLWRRAACAFRPLGTQLDASLDV
jgi:type I restriction enzyme M protein